MHASMRSLNKVSPFSGDEGGGYANRQQMMNIGPEPPATKKRRKGPDLPPLPIAKLNSHIRTAKKADKQQAGGGSDYATSEANLLPTKPNAKGAFNGTKGFNDFMRSKNDALQMYNPLAAETSEIILQDRASGLPPIHQASY